MLSILRWKIENFLFTGYAEVGIPYYASITQPRENWPLAIWRRNGFVFGFKHTCIGVYVRAWFRKL